MRINLKVLWRRRAGIMRLLTYATHCQPGALRTATDIMKDSAEYLNERRPAAKSRAT